ncbi:MAG: argininosuccinate synthase [Planctomycetes bacterium]|nr:argininosuccinate synthase [Planctomycetota bacterium]
MKKVVLAFSGGHGTKAALHLLRRKYGPNVITYTANLGQKGSTEGLCERAIALGASSAHIADLRERFVEGYIFPALRAGAVCESGYALAHALARPMIVAEMVKIAREEGADLLAHGCAAKSNDQVRFETSAAALAPEMRVLNPLRDANLLHDDEVAAYCQKHDLTARKEDPGRFSITENLYGSSVQWNHAPDSFDEVPDEVFRRTRPIAGAPDAPGELTISFKHGLPCSLDGENLPSLELIHRVSTVAGEHGVGRLVTLEDRLIGIKMVEVYEQPAATILHMARQALERLVLSPDMLQFKSVLSRKFADLTYQGFWFSELREALDAFFLKATEFVTGDVRVRMHKGHARVTGARSRYSLYSQAMAEPTTEGDAFSHSAVRGFMETISQPLRAAPREGWKPREADE